MPTRKATQHIRTVLSGAAAAGVVVAAVIAAGRGTAMLAPASPSKPAEVQITIGEIRESLAVGVRQGWRPRAELDRFDDRFAGMEHWTYRDARAAVGDAPGVTPIRH